jgi:hypothetical protein
VLNYSGRQSSSGGALLFGISLTPRGALRRMTVGATWNMGGLESWSRPVIPRGTDTPFSQANLNAQIRRNAVGRSPWRGSVSPYIEHELGFLLESRVRIGYQYWYQPGSYRGLFPVQQSESSPVAAYNVKLSNSGHMVRLSINSYTSLDDADNGTAARKRSSGFVRQAGMQIGPNNFTIFVAVGPSWSF